MKKFLALLMAAMMLLSVSAFALAEEEAGFDEFDLGVEGEQTVGFLTMSMVYFQPVDMAPTDLATPKEGSDLHIEVDLTAEENEYGFNKGEWVPYLTIDYVVLDAEGNQIADGTMMPMNASDGQHSGNIIALPEGEGYSVKLSIKNPGENGMLLHTDETGPEADAWWDEPIEATWTGWNFVKEW